MSLTRFLGANGSSKSVILANFSQIWAISELARTSNFAQNLPKSGISGQIRAHGQAPKSDQFRGSSELSKIGAQKMPLGHKIMATSDVSRSLPTSKNGVSKFYSPEHKFLALLKFFRASKKIGTFDTQKHPNIKKWRPQKRPNSI